MVTIKKAEGRNLETLSEIWSYLGPQKIILDLINIVILVADISI